MMNRLQHGILVIALSFNTRPVSALKLKLPGSIMVSRVDTMGEYNISCDNLQYFPVSKTKNRYISYLPCNKQLGDVAFYVLNCSVFVYYNLFAFMLLYL